MPGDFEWTEQTWGAALQCPSLGAVHLFTTRRLDPQSPAQLHELATALGVHRVVMATQVHGCRALIVRRGVPVPDARPEADVLVSEDPDVAIAVRAADCVPVLLSDRVRGVVAAVHAGWRGTAARASVVAVETLRREFGSVPDDLVAAIGPSIGPCCYEVGSELVDAFAAVGHERHLIDRWFLAPPPARGFRERPRMRLDLAGANRDQLQLAGLSHDRIHSSGLCTAMHLDVLTSYRVEKEKAGRLVAAIRARG